MTNTFQQLPRVRLQQRLPVGAQEKDNRTKMSMKRYDDDLIGEFAVLQCRVLPDSMFIKIDWHSQPLQQSDCPWALQQTDASWNGSVQNSWGVEMHSKDRRSWNTNCVSFEQPTIVVSNKTPRAMKNYTRKEPVYKPDRRVDAEGGRTACRRQMWWRDARIFFWLHCPVILGNVIK